MPFVRSIDQKLADALNTLSAEEGSWWKALIEDPKVFIAIRENALNAYCGGASLGRISWKKGAPSFRVHVEYLVFADRGRKDMYFDFLQESENPRSVIVKNTDEYVKHFSAVKALARDLASQERAGVNDIAARHKCVLDIEAAFNTRREPKDSEPNPEPTGGRIDLVAVDDPCHLVFTEAKLFVNDELKCDTLFPPVCNQLIAYHQWLNDRGKEIQEAYSHLIEKCHLDGKFFRRWDRLQKKQLTVDLIPRLLIFGYSDRDTAELEQIRTRITEEVCRRIPGFRLEHIRCRKQASSVQASDIL